MTKSRDVPTIEFDPVNTPVDQIDLTNTLIMHSVIVRLQDEARYWRQNAACWLSTALHDRGRTISPGQLAYEQGPDRRVREFGAVLGEALAGRFYPGCEGCAAEVRPGDPVVNCDEVGEMHAACNGASAEEIAAGRQTLPFDSLMTDNLTETEIEALRQDPHARIYPAEALFTTEQIGRFVAEAKVPRDSEHSDSALQHTPLYVAVDALAQERIRQVSKEGWTAEHDDAQPAGALAYAAANYAQEAGHQAEAESKGKPREPGPLPHFLSWPWAESWWRPADTDRTLVKAGALILAELERRARARAAAKGSPK